jgi:riboflavin kinase/FMN adenylyltransferase
VNTDLKITIRGKVRMGNKRGRLLGFPTANVPLHKKIPEGIYMSRVSCDGQMFNALTFIGTAKTFDEEVYQSETYILDFDQDIYGKYMTIHLLKKIRQNQKFVNADELVKQMQRDTIKARLYFQTYADNK